MKYADAYVSLLLLTGNGSIIIFNRNKEEFQRPPVESIKSILNHIESGVFYFPMTFYFDAIGLSRFQSFILITSWKCYCNVLSYSYFFI